MSENMKRAFTLIEIMIVLTVIGVLSAVLIPVAMNSMPDENVMKFKKAHAELYNVIGQLVTSDKYYLDGDMGVRADGTVLDGTHSGDKSYFCNSFSEMISAKSNNCATLDSKTETSRIVLTLDRYTLTAPSWDNPKQILDDFCNYQNRSDASALSYCLMNVVTSNNVT